MIALRARYRIACPADEIEAQARGIALEQTVEVPDAIVTDPAIRDHIVGQVADITPDGDDAFHVAIDYNPALANHQLPQLLNLLYGNISLKNNIRLEHVDFPDAFLSHFKGPNHGAAGLRDLVGVHGRPLLATAIKPRGSSVATFARIAGDFARGGGDLVKDDHNLVDDSLDAFQKRIAACHEAVERVNAQTGRRCLYLPNVCARFNELDAHLEAVVRLGVRGILISPMLVGLDAVRHAAETYGLLVMAHPTAAGTFFHDRAHGITPAVLLGTFFRLAGADVTIYPNAGGRFGFTHRECADINAAMAAPLGALKPGLGAPSGGMKLANVPDMCERFGADAVLLIGGALLSHSDDLAASTRVFADAIREHFDERLAEPAATPAGACELPDAGRGVVIEHLAFDNFTWAGRMPGDYKSSDAGDVLPFKDVIRHELLGKNDEPMAFDVRYFEIGPGGHSSLEKHAHIHAVIAVRGRGVLINGDGRHTLEPMDIAYVPPMRVHQLRNAASDDAEPFGFFCIVDRDRDRPTAP